MAEQLVLPLSFNPTLEFEQFQPGPNAELVGHLKRSTQAEGEPLIFLWGETGSGKSHLLNASCRRASRHGLSVCYLPLTQLHHHGPVILEGADEQDIVCIDDLDQVAGHPEWELALFTLFNQLRERQSRLIMTAHAPPGQIAINLADLNSRLSWGLVLRILPLSDADKVAALEIKARSLGLELPAPVSRYLISRQPRELPALIRLLEQLDHASLAAQRRLTVPFVKSRLKDSV